MEEKKEDSGDRSEYLSTFSYVKEKSDGDLKTDAGEGIY